MVELSVIFIAVLVVMIALNVFMLFVIKSTSAVVGRQIRGDALRLFSVYEDILVEKSKKLREMELELAAMPKTTRQKAVVHRKPTAQKVESVSKRKRATPEYLSKDFAAGYRSMQEKFTMDKENIISSVYKERENGKGAIAVAILEKISFDTVFKLTGISKESQWEIVNELLEGNEIAVLHSFAQTADDFDIVRFYDELKMMAEFENGQVYVRTGSPKENFDGIENGVITIYDEKLCEGIQVISGNKLYDFSIGERDIG